MHDRTSLGGGSPNQFGSGIGGSGSASARYGGGGGDQAAEVDTWVVMEYCNRGTLQVKCHHCFTVCFIHLQTHMDMSSTRSGSNQAAEVDTWVVIEYCNRGTLQVCVSPSGMLCSCLIVLA